MRQKDPWWRFQDLVHDETKVKPHDEFKIRIDQAIKELEDLKKEKWVNHSFNWDKIQPIRNLLDEMEELKDGIYLPAYKMNMRRLFITTTDEEIKNDQSIKDYLGKDK